MRDFEQFLNAYLMAKGYRSDADMARAYGFSRTNMSKIRHKGHATNELCLEIAQVIGVEAGVVMASRNADKEPGAVGDAWRKLLERVAVVLLVAVCFHPYPADAKDLTEMTQVIDSSSKDYRKYRILQLFQSLARILARLFPVIPLTSTTAQNAL